MPALANIGVIWAIFIVISIVAQVIKASKKVSSEAPGTDDGPRGGPAESNDELRQFLEQLGGGGAATPKPLPPRPPAPPRPAVQRREPTMRVSPEDHRQNTPQATPSVVRRRAVTEAPPHEPHATPPPPPAVPERVRPKPQKQRSETVQIELPASSASQAASKLQRLIRDELQQTEDTRKAIVLREVLGPPLALRSRQL
ncbi:MAG: hypothetical protein HN341_08490 [Verrucomicrobia bacterium]|jgi:hypothetical protein|nr:hypothetical protein [Verrucomicrobiota bacterium]